MNVLTTISQGNMDYAFYQAILFIYGITMILLFYDVYCFYCRHLMERFDKSPGLSMPEDVQVDGGIDQFHVHGHVKECYPRYSPNFIPGAGIQTADIIETLWVKTNQIADSTRGMSSAHRQESIDDIMNDSNWTKLTRHSTDFPAGLALR